MKKLVIGLICLFQVMCLPNISVKANETTTVRHETSTETTNSETTVTTEESTTVSTMVEVPEELIGAQVADYLVADQFYQITIKNTADEVVYQKDDAIFLQSDLEKLQAILKSSSHLYIDLGDGQYALPVASLRLVNQTLTFIYDDVIGYSAVFHEGVVTNSGMIISDASDPVIETVTIEQPDISGWVVNQPSNMTAEILTISLKNQEYWATMPYKVGVNGDVLDESNTIYLGAFTLTESPYNLHLNIVPKTEAPKEKENNRRLTNKLKTALDREKTVQENTTTDNAPMTTTTVQDENMQSDTVTEMSHEATSPSVDEQPTIPEMATSIETTEVTQSQYSTENTVTTRQTTVEDLQAVVPNQDNNRRKLPLTGETSGAIMMIVVPLLVLGLLLVVFNKKEKI
ncbi:LPXTG cell wall anchor domain-containing protein [Globicatella sp. PHS-GS-PNBC-21-1553]|uniref:LPXTG cell wall anchor domain-containing protein n=1 Tax=Globicatella sp. PHS-GS-PNBC-21-1553 TaxID=2885764 RepID=UPI00298F02E1|nr:LPXTG cell wall anchor domain-containing protein [Globicatella sp. PHS-GS-PNBC-21-1553]WPC09198.1 LPXTG cell wall anchor domain-containing protein [Globicatella sp. PHS-GS-PNBC-21-1553]